MHRVRLSSPRQRCKWWIFPKQRMVIRPNDCGIHPAYLHPLRLFRCLRQYEPITPAAYLSSHQWPYCRGWRWQYGLWHRACARGGRRPPGRHASRGRPQRLLGWWWRLRRRRRRLGRRRRRLRRRLRGRLWRRRLRLLSLRLLGRAALAERSSTLEVERPTLNLGASLQLIGRERPTQVKLPPAGPATRVSLHGYGPALTRTVRIRGLSTEVT